MGLLSDNTTKVVKIVVRSTRTFNNTFRLFVANVSKGESLTEVTNFTVTEVTPDPGYAKQYEVLYTFTDLIIGENQLTVKIIGEDEIQRIGTYIVIRNYPSDTETIPTSENEYPTLTNFFPTNEATNVQRVLQLLWNSVDPEGDPITFDVFFGKSETPNLVSFNQVAPIYPSTMNLKLDAGAKYAWKVIAKNTSGITESDTLWFQVAHAPDVPNNPFPIYNSIEVDPTNITLLWDSSSVDSNPLIYDVYFGISFTPPLVATGVGDKFYNVGALNGNTTYYWKIVVTDNKGNTVPGPKWKFKTGQ